MTKEKPQHRLHRHCIECDALLGAPRPAMKSQLCALCANKKFTRELRARRDQKKDD